MSLKDNLNVLRKTKKSIELFSVLIKKEVRKIDKECNKTVETIKFIDSARFMASSLWNLVDILTEGIHKIKCRNCDCFPEYKCVEGNLIIYKCLSSNKCYSKMLNEEFQKREFQEHI